VPSPSDFQRDALDFERVMADVRAAGG